MALIIDGYNLLYASGILGGGRGPGFLERSRQALLNFLAESLDAKAVSRCQVVFDASIENAPRGLPRRLTHRGITVHFAAGLPSADELIEELIVADSAPRYLTVVSSDHRLQRAARRRKATAVDSDIWFHQVRRKRAARRDPGLGPDIKPDAPASAFEVNFWLQQFGAATEQPTGPSPADRPQTDGDFTSLENPFPPGYGEDLLDQDS
jgi:predicted RNA-binding protein with PIN domain